MIDWKLLIWLFIGELTGFWFGCCGERVRAKKEMVKELKRISVDLRSRIMIGPNDLCTCTCADSCPLGKVGLQARCTAEELVNKGVNVKTKTRHQYLAGQIDILRQLTDYVEDQ